MLTQTLYRISSILFLSLIFQGCGGSGNVGAIDGTLLLNGSPAPEGTLVACEISESSEMDSSGHFSVTMYRNYATTEQDGSFRFENLPAGDVTWGKTGPTSVKRYLGGFVTLEKDSFGDFEGETIAKVNAGGRTDVVVDVATASP